MTKTELKKELELVLKKISNVDKKQFLIDLKQINKEIDKLDSVLKNILDKFSILFTINIDKKIIKIIDDIAENIEDPKLEDIVKVKIDNLIENFLSKISNTNENNKTASEQGKSLWKEAKKVRKAL